MKTHETPQRGKLLEMRRVSKMAESAHAYVRGNTLQFYQWLSSDSAKLAVPEGPEVWICGDCHTGNLGPIASAQGDVEIEIRDVDQTVVGNPAHDLLRLGLSLAMAARSSDLPGVTTALMLEEMILGYQARLVGASAKITPDEIRPIRKVMREARARRWRHLAQERIDGVEPHIPLGKKYWAVQAEEREGVAQLVKGHALQVLLGKLRGDRLGEQVKLLDMAYWMKGCSSLGQLRYALLIALGKRKDREYHLLDIKQAAATVAPRGRAPMPENHAERVVTGARALSPYLGERMIPTTIQGKQCIVRELRPQDMKFELNGLTQKQAIQIARLMAGVVGRAHGRQMDEATRRSWSKELRERHSKGLDAPRWLWSGVLDLAALHESAYLEHCRRYALGKQESSQVRIA